MKLPPRRTPAGSPELRSVFEARFDEEIARLLVERSRILQWSVLVLYPAFWFLDLIYRNEIQIYEFLAIRLAVALMCLVGLLLVSSRYSRFFSQPTIFVNAFACAVGISYMSARLGGFDSTYFVGNIIVIFVVGYFMPWRVSVSMALCGLIVLAYVLINSLLATPSHWSEAVPPVFFMIGTVVFTAIATYTGRQTQRRDLSFRVQLENANEELKQLDEAKTRFFANVSHELRTPLTLLLGPIDSLRVNRQTSEEGRLLDAMKTNANRLLRQVDALLDIAKIESGSLRLEATEGNVGEMLAEIVRSAGPHAEQRGVELVGKGLDDLEDSYFDADKVWIIAGNLISNALKFTARGKVEVRAGVDGNELFFEVSDTGPGIPETEQEKIFDRFYQVDASFSREHPGTGIGLALARELARLHGGDLTVRSNVGEGSTFRASLPRRPQDLPDRRQKPRRREDRLAQARTMALTAREYQRVRDETLLADVEVPKISPRSDDAPTETGPTILLVEDNDDLRNYLARSLSSQYRMLVARDGLEALSTLHRKPVDLVVSDLMMPRMDGQQLCAEIRADGALSRIPIIIVTARASSEAVIEGLKLGADDYVTKPFVVNELEARIAAHLRRKRAEDELIERDSRLAAIGQMSSAVAHDLRNALTIVKGYAELADQIAQEETRSQAIITPLQQIRSAVDRLGRMTEEILHFARGGTPTLDRDQIALLPFLRRTLEPMRTDLERRDIELHLDVDSVAEDLCVDLDPDAMVRVFENLLGNARDVLAPLDAPRRIRVEAKTREDRIELSINDNGPGIPDDLVGSLFEPFKSGKRSTGLGLATVRNIVKAHDGEIEVRPKGPDGGATFKLLLPVRVTSAGGQALSIDH